jgi:hypothetical protein
MRILILSIFIISSAVHGMAINMSLIPMDPELLQFLNASFEKGLPWWPQNNKEVTRKKACYLCALCKKKSKEVKETEPKAKL